MPRCILPVLSVVRRFRSSHHLTATLTFEFPDHTPSAHDLAKLKQLLAV